MNEVPWEYWIPAFLLSRKAILKLSKCPVFLLMPWKCLQLIIEQFYSTPFVGVKSRKVFLSISNRLTAWISQFHKLRKKIVCLQNSVVHEMPWKTWKTPDQMHWHKETLRMHFIYRVGHILITTWEGLLNANLTELTQWCAFSDVVIKVVSALNWLPPLMRKYLKVKEKHLSQLGQKYSLSLQSIQN